MVYTDIVLTIVAAIVTFLFISFVGSYIGKAINRMSR